MKAAYFAMQSILHSKSLTWRERVEELEPDGDRSLIVLGVGLIVLGVAGLWVYVSATAPTLHRTQEVKSVASGDSGSPVDGRSRAGTTDRPCGSRQQNLPGVSVAVGAGGGHCGPGLWVGESRTGARVARDAVQDRHRLYGAHVAAVGLLLEKTG